MNTDGLVLNGVEKRFPGFQLGPVTMSLRPGLAYGLLGPNGAGKTTLLNLIALQLRASAGTLSFEGAPLVWGDDGWKSRFSYIRETPAFYDELSVSTTLALAARLYDRWDAGFAVQLVERLGLDGRKAVGRLSKGNKVKLGLVVALAHHADVLMLDEPTAGLDPDARAELQVILRGLMTERPGLVLLLSSHIFEDIERVADEILIVRDGRIVFQETLQTLRAMPLYRMPERTPGLQESDARLCWTYAGQVWVMPTAEAAARVRSIPECESVAGGATLETVYRGTEHLCEHDKRLR
jgi:ABC-2 type transport system ATP-binding protein